MFPIKLMGITKCSNMVACLAHRPFPTTLGDGVKRSKFNFFRNGDVANQIYLIQKCSNMVANILLTDTPLTLGMGLIGNMSTFLEHGHVKYHI